MRGVDVGDRDDLVNYATGGLRLKIASKLRFRITLRFCGVEIRV